MTTRQIYADYKTRLAVLNRFEEHGVPISADWVDACIAFCTSESAEFADQATLLSKAVFEQWLACDMSMDNGVLDMTRVGAKLPTAALTSHKFVVAASDPPPCRCVFQVVRSHDISRPAYSQVDKLDNEREKITAASQAEGYSVKEASTTGKRLSRSEEPIQKRVQMLIFELTNGQQKIKAIEHQPLDITKQPIHNRGAQTDAAASRSALQKLAYATKVALIPPLTFRSGYLMATPHNFQILVSGVQSVVADISACGDKQRTTDIDITH